MINDDLLIEKGKIHLERHRENFFKLVDGDFYSFLKATMILLEWVYQDGRLDSLMELERGVSQVADLTLDRFIKNATYEITEDGVRFKVFGIPYFLTEKELADVILSLMNFVERIKIIRKEKERLCRVG